MCWHPSQGDQGLRGIRGLHGPPGIAGPSGPKVRIKGTSILLWSDNSLDEVLPRIIVEYLAVEDLCHPKSQNKSSAGFWQHTYCQNEDEHE